MIVMPGFSARAAVAMPEMSPPPPIATHRQSSVRLLRQHLERDRALPGDHVGVVIRMHHRQAAARCEQRRFLAGVVEGVAASG